MLTAEQNFRLLQEIEANRSFLLMVYQQNPQLLKCADARIKSIFAQPQLNDEAETVRTMKQRGISLVELIMFIVIVSVALAGILLVMNVTTRGSVDPLIHKQALAIAESLLEEVELMPFTYCDPNDPNGNAGDPALTTGTASCTAGWSQDVITGPTPNTETRYSATNPFDNVADYSGCQMNTGPANGCTGGGGIRDINNNPIGPAAGYSASIAISRIGTTLVPALPTADAALLITVTVTGSDGLQVVMEGIRTRYSPNGVP